MQYTESKRIVTLQFTKGNWTILVRYPKFFNKILKKIVKVNTHKSYLIPLTPEYVKSIIKKGDIKIMSTVNVFEIEINSSMSKSEIIKKLEKISDTVEIEDYKNTIHNTLGKDQVTNVIEVIRGQNQTQTIYEIVFDDERLSYAAKSIREIILGGDTK